MNTSSADILWSPSHTRVQQSHMARFMSCLNQKYKKKLKSYQDLHHFSTEDLECFWRELSDFIGVNWLVPPLEGREVCQREAGKMLGTRWFPGTKLNFAQNLLFPQSDMSPHECRITSIVEGKEHPICIEHGELILQVARCQAHLQHLGVKKGDRIVAVVGNTYHAVVAMLAATSLGAVWSSCSPDFGVQAIVDRFAQISPKLIFATSEYCYNGKIFTTQQTISAVLSAIPSIEHCISINPLETKNSCEVLVPSGVSLMPWEIFSHYDHERITSASCSQYLYFEPLDFEHPLYILYSSGTTGVPKCIVHSVGGTLMQHKKELMLHCDLHSGERILYYTTCGWMMWNWMVSALAVQGELILFEGSLLSPDIGILWRTLEKYKVNIFGTSPKFLAQNMLQEFSPKNSDFDLSSLKTILSTGAPLLPEQFDWVYQQVKSDVSLASISGGTDIVSCFLLGNPLSPVRRGELQGPGLGMAVEIWNSEGEKVPQGEKGELVCTQPFVSMPTGFWGDDTGSKYFETYFAHFKTREVWCHGDYVQQSLSGGYVILGRSDATLNPGGVRIGTAEIYRVVENMQGVEDSLIVGLPTRGDVDVVLFLKMTSSAAFNLDFEKKLRGLIRQKLSPRHVPAHIIPIEKIPYTRSGKKMELAVQKTLLGIEVKNEGAMIDQYSLEPYKVIYQRTFKDLQ